MTGKQHALKILNAIQAAEADGFMVELDTLGTMITVANRYELVQPRFEDGVWELETDD